MQLWLTWMEVHILHKLMQVNKHNHLMLTSKKGSIARGHTTIPSSIDWSNSEFKHVTCTGAGQREIELRHTAAICEHSHPSVDIVDLYVVIEVRFHVRNV